MPTGKLARCHRILADATEVTPYSEGPRGIRRISDPGDDQTSHVLDVSHQSKADNSAEAISNSSEEPITPQTKIST
jgi:hypothetical protein